MSGILVKPSMSQILITLTLMAAMWWQIMLIQPMGQELIFLKKILLFRDILRLI